MKLRLNDEIIKYLNLKNDLVIMIAINITNGWTVICVSPEKHLSVFRRNTYHNPSIEIEHFSITLIGSVNYVPLLVSY